MRQPRLVPCLAQLHEIDGLAHLLLHLIQTDDLALPQRSSVASNPAFQPGLTLEDMERQYIRSVLREEHGKVTQAAARLGIPRSTLYQKIKTYGIPIDVESSEV